MKYELIYDSQTKEPESIWEVKDDMSEERCIWCYDNITSNNDWKPYCLVINDGTVYGRSKWITKEEAFLIAL